MRSLFHARLAMTNIRLNRRVYIPYMLTCVGTAALYYIIYSLSQNTSLSTTFGGGQIAFILYLGANAIAIFAVLFLFYTNSFLLKRRKKEFGLYSILGMEKKHIALTMLFETLYILIISVILGLASGMLLAKLMHLLLLKLLHLGVQMGIEVAAGPILRTAALFIGIFVLMFLNTARVVYRSRPIELLHGSETGEKEPKAKWAITLLGVLCLGGGYFLAIMIEEPIAALLMFFVAVILVVIGTYCLFTSGSISLLRLLKCNKSYYYKTRHFISVSGMMYRMKQNAAGLASICIFCTCVLVILSMTISLYIGVEDALRLRYPRNILMKIRDAAPETIEVVDAAIDSALEEAQLTPINQTRFHYSTFIAMPNDSEMTDIRDANYIYDYDSTLLIAISLSDYNANLGTDIRLAPGEVLLCVETGRYDGDTIRFGERTYTIKERIDNPDLFGGVTTIRANTFHLIMPDEGAIAHIRSIAQNEEERSASENSAYWRGFDLETPKDRQVALFGDIEERLHDQSIGGLTFESEARERDFTYSVYGGLFFVGIFLGAMFIMATVLTIYYKQISEGYDDNARFRIMRKVGMSHAEVRAAIRSQVLTVFFLPLIMAAVHVAFAFNMIVRLLSVLNLTNIALFAVCCVGTLLVFSLFYALVYAITARTYYKIVSV